jgi:O-antigen ligase
MRALVALVYFSLVFERSALPYNTAPADALIAVGLFIGVVWMTRQGSFSTTLLRKCSFWIWLIVLGSLLGLTGVGLTFWAFSSLARLLAALLTFFAFLHLFVTRSRLVKSAIAGIWAGWGLTIFWLAMVEGISAIRPTAFFTHPNYAGHYLVAAGVILFVYHRSVRTRVAVLVLTAVGVFATASFGAMAMGGALVAVGLFRVVGRQVVALLIVLVSLSVLIVMLFGFEVQLDADSTRFEVNETVNQDRFDRSRDGRLELWRKSLEAWTQSPMGVGPDGVNQREIGTRIESNRLVALEIHADALGYLVERGVIGLIGYLGLWFALWTFAERKGLARALIISLLVAGLFRETMHYRHGWLLLSVAFAVDFQRTLARRRASQAIQAA